MTDSFQVAILAGGAGTRLKARAGTLPKPLVPILGTPALERQIALCRRHGLTRILLLVHHGHEAIREQLGDGTAHGVTLGYQVEATPLGTAGALRDALARLANSFLVLYGDVYLDVDLQCILDAHAAHQADATLFVHPNDHPHDSDLVELDGHGRIIGLHAYPHPAHGGIRNLAVAALFAIERRALEAAVASGVKSDLVRDAVPAMLTAGCRLHGYVSPEYIKDFGTPERLDEVERAIAGGVPDRLSGRSLRQAVFLDRDGTLNHEVHHLREPDQVEFAAGSPEAVRRLNHAGVLAVVVTNQAIVARGAVTPDGLDRIHARLEEKLGREGAYLDGLYVCPHHPDGGFPGEVPELKIRCECRKPDTGLIDRACRELRIDRNPSWLVGDSTSDIEAGRRAGLRTVLLRTGHAGGDGKHPFRPDYVSLDLPAAVGWILEGHAVVCRRMAPVALAGLDARVALIGGQARSGKSYAAQVLKELMAAFGRTAHVVSLDSWLKPAGERAEGTGVARRFDVDGILASLRPIAGASDHRRFELPVYDRARRAMYEKRVDISIGPEDLLIVEGVPALLIPELAELAGARVHVEMPEPLRIAHLRADYRWRGETKAAVNALLASRAADEWTAVEDGRRRATAVIAAWTGA